MARLAELLAEAERPLAIVGEGGWTARTGLDVAAFAEAQHVPVVASFRCQDYVDNRSPAYAGHATLGMDAALAARDPRRGPAARDRRAPGRDHDRRLHAGAPAGAGAAPGPRPPRSRRAGDGAHAGARHRLRPRGVRRRRGEARAGDRTPGPAPGGPCGLRAQPARRAGAARRAADVRRHGDAARAARPGRDPHQRRGQLHDLGAPLLRVPPPRHAARAAQRLDGLRPARGRRREGRPPRSGRRVRRGRRRLPHERAGAGHRGAGGPAGRRRSS